MRTASHIHRRGDRRARARDQATTVGYQMRRMPLRLSDRLRLEAVRQRRTKESIVIECLEIGLKVMREGGSDV